jgi:hypothetical protein
MSKHKANRGYLAYPKIDSYDPVFIPEVSLTLHNMKRKQQYNPFDLGYHSHGLEFAKPHSKPILRHKPQSGFWRSVGIDG